MTSVKDQQGDEASLLNFYRKTASIRNKSTLYENGTVEAVDTGNGAIYMMKFSDDTHALVVVHNYSDIEQTVQIEEKIASVDHVQDNQLKDHVLTLQPFGTSVVYLEGTTQ